MTPLPGLRPPRPARTRCARPFVALVHAEDVLASDELLLVFSAAIEGCATVTLTIDANRLDPAVAGAELQALVVRCRIRDDDRDRPDRGRRCRRLHHVPRERDLIRVPGPRRFFWCLVTPRAIVERLTVVPFWVIVSVTRSR